MGLDFEYNHSQTPIDEEEKAGLLISTITTLGELDEFEQHNIEKAVLWSLNKKFTPAQIFTSDFIKNLHKRMYGQVWSWAGEFRKTDKNIGVPWHRIQLDLQQLLDDAIFWHENQIYSPDEIAIRFKHRLVSIHCFSNGNGRHSRLMADITIEKLYGQPIFTWGEKNLAKESDLRKEYISSLQAADQGEYTSLLSFARM
ncbi:MAG TPA: mobile mystery protein B [Saprospiraceae bacterium]|nr:mobile mystery protein B [Saprospiraceae bacterium]